MDSKMLGFLGLFANSWSRAPYNFECCPIWRSGGGEEIQIVFFWPWHTTVLDHLCGISETIFFWESFKYIFIKIITCSKSASFPSIFA